MEIIDDELLDSITELASKSPRLRMNHNFHKSLDSKAQRLLNAMEPGTELPIHRHLDTDETYMLLRGSLEVHLYNEKKELIETNLLDPLQGKFGVNIPAGQWHCIKVMESGTVIFEVKDGPYCPLKKEDVLE